MNSNNDDHGTIDDRDVTNKDSSQAAAPWRHKSAESPSVSLKSVSVTPVMSSSGPGPSTMTQLNSPAADMNKNNQSQNACQGM